MAIDSTPSQGTRRVADWLAARAKEMGFHCELQEDQAVGVPQANLFLRPQSGRPSQEFIFQARLDTPDPGPFGLWRATGQNPFDAHIIDGRIYGLGTANCKLDFLCKLQALARCQERSKEWKVPPVLVGTFGCDNGMPGALKLIRKSMVSAKQALIGEPSDLKILAAGKGNARVQIRVPFESDEQAFREEHNMRESTSTMSKTFRGRPAPSWSPQKGDSAIRKMFDYLAQLPESITIMGIEGGVDANSVAASAYLEIDPVSGFTFPMAKKLNRIGEMMHDLEDRFLQYLDPEFSPEHPTLNVGRIRTFDQFVELDIDVRIPASVSNETYEEWMAEAAKVCQTVGAQFLVNYYKRPYRTPVESSLVATALSILKEAGGDAEPATHSSTNEASLFSRVGIECISFGPGVREGNIHTPEENVSLEDLKRATDFYAAVMERFCR